MPLTVIYYPYSRALKPSTLRKAVLLFDALWFLDSEPWFVRAALTRDKLTENPAIAEPDEIEEDYRLLRTEGFVRVLDATSIVRDHDELLTANVINDISEDEFCRQAIGYSAAVWNILRDRIPPKRLSRSSARNSG